MGPPVFVLAFSVAFVAASALRPDTVTGTASWYGEAYRGRIMANGQPFNPNAMTAASWDFPLGTRVRVTHDGREIVVTITDHGPAQRLRQQGRVIDLSEAAFARLAPTSVGLIVVSLKLETQSLVSQN